MATQSISLLITPTGVWTPRDDAQKGVFEELTQASDRAAAIIAGSIVEVRLREAIAPRLKRDVEIERDLFHSSGPLGSFHWKIEIAYLMGIVSAEARMDLRVVKDVRNLFAHDLNVKDFSTDKIRDKSKNLKLIDTHAGDDPAGSGAGSPVMKLKPGDLPKIFVRDYMERKARARDRYLLTCSIFCVALALPEVHSTGLLL